MITGGTPPFGGTTTTSGWGAMKCWIRFFIMFNHGDTLWQFVTWKYWKYGSFNWLLVGPPLWNIWLRQLGWWHSIPNISGKISNMATIHHQPDLYLIYLFNLNRDFPQLFSYVYQRVHTTTRCRCTERGDRGLQRVGNTQTTEDSTGIEL